MNKKFEREVLKLQQTWRVVSGWYFCMMPVELILCGFALDKSSGGAYIWRYAFPLFDLTPISFTFGQRLPYPEDFLPMPKGDEQAAASEFVSRVARYEAETLKLSEPAQFLAHAESMNAFRNPWVRRGYALTLIMLGRMADAAAELNILLEDESINDIPRFRKDMAGIAHALSVNPSSAISTLQGWAADNRRALGLQNDRST